MKLLTVGSSPQSNVYINSQFVSGYHADILLLDNGDILIVDKSSTNGTKINGNSITPGIEVPVRRGDTVVFADSQLDWNKIPSVKVDPNAKQIIGIGSHSRNRIHITGEKVSRFHATIKQTNDGHWFICDHSTNGTTINGTRIGKDLWIKIKKGDQICCAGVPVDNPIPGRSFSGSHLSVILSCAAAVIVLAVAGLLIFKSGSMPDKKIYNKHSTSSVFVICEYHFKVSAGSLDVVSLFKSDEFYFNTLGEPEPFDGENSHIATATGFFISSDGLIATNLHVARPWMVDDGIIQPVEDYFRDALNDISRVSSYRYVIPYISQLKVEGVIDHIRIIPTGMYFETDNLISCSEIAASKDKDIDLAILRTRQGSGSIPQGCTYVNINQIPNDKSYAQGAHTYTFGYPTGIGLQDVEHKLLEAIGVPGSIMSVNDDASFMLNADVLKGASGSPVFDDHGHLLGIMSRSNANGYSAAIRAKYLKDLLDEKGIKY